MSPSDELLPASPASTSPVDVTGHIGDVNGHIAVTQDTI
jgi:hypothetical protein